MAGHHHKKHNGSKRSHSKSPSVELDEHATDNGDHGPENGGSVANDKEEAVSAPASPKLEDRNGLPKDHLASPRAEKRPASPAPRNLRFLNGVSKDGESSPRSQPPSPTSEHKVATLQQLNDTLVRQVAVLRSDKDSLMEKVTQLEEQLSTVKETREAIIALKIEHSDLVSEVADKQLAWEEENTTLKEESAKLAHKLLEAENSLCHVKEEFEAAVSKSGRELAEAATQIEEAERRAVGAKEKMETLSKELETLTSVNRKLGDDFDCLQATAGERGAEVDSLRSERDVLKDEIQRLAGALSTAEEEVKSAKKVIEEIRAKQETLQQEKARLEAASSEALAHTSVLETRNKEFGTKVEGLEATVSGLQDELLVSQRKAAEAIQILEKEKEALRIGRLASIEKNDFLEEELQAERSSVQKLQAIIETGETRIKVLEVQVANLQKERGSSEERRKVLEIQLRKASATSAEASARAESELAMWQVKVKGLEATLESAKSECNSSEKKAWDLLSELRSVKIVLEKKSRITRYGLPAATATGALAAVSLIAFLKFSRRR